MKNTKQQPIPRTMYRPTLPTTAQQAAWWQAMDLLDVPQAQALIAEGVDPWFSHPELRSTAMDTMVGMVGNTSGATVRKVLDMVAVLIEAGVDPAFPQPHAQSTSAPLWWALSATDNRLARAMMEARTWSSDPKDMVSGRALELVVQHHPDLLPLLFERGVSPSALHVKDFTVTTATVLSKTLGKGSVQAVRALLDAGAQCTSHEMGQEQDLFSMVLRGVPTGLPNGRFTLPTQKGTLAAHQRAMFDLLCERGHALTRRAQILGQAVRLRAPLATLEHLVTLGAELNGVTPKKGSTALHVAVNDALGFPYVEPLLAMGADPSLTDANGKTALEFLRAKHWTQPQAQALAAVLEGHALRSVWSTEQETTVLAVPRRRL